VGSSRVVSYGVRRVLSTFKRVRWNMRITALKRPLRWRDLEELIEVAESDGHPVTEGSWI
jgi:hypothetical protein